MTEDYRTEQLDPAFYADREMLQAFLKKNGLVLEEDVDCAFGIFDLEDNLCGCGCAAGSLLKCFAVEESLRGQNALGTLVSSLVQNRFQKGFRVLRVITRSHNRDLFLACGFYEVVSAGGLTMLENVRSGPETFARSVMPEEKPAGRIGAVVMNCNPFTLGHRALVEYAAAHCDFLYLFVVEEDRSDFPAEVRFRLVEEGTADLPKVHVVKSGPYMISQATFPTYFLKQDEDAVSLQTELDITLFAERIAPALGIGMRFAGEEPKDPVTARYNEAMARILPAAGIAFKQIPRITGDDGEVVSASYVRKLLKEKGVCPEVLSMVPETTAAYLRDEWKRAASESGD